MKINSRVSLFTLSIACSMACGCGANKPVEKGPIPPGRYTVIDRADNLNNIALRAYGDMKFWYGLLNANPELTKRPGFDLIPGETITVPAMADLNNKLPKSVFPKQLPADYIVMLGDSLPFIAKECYGDRKLWKRIYEANRNVLSQQVEKNPYLLIAGQVLHIPAGESGKAQAEQGRKGGE